MSLLATTSMVITIRNEVTPHLEKLLIFIRDIGKEDVLRSSEIKRILREFRDHTPFLIDWHYEDGPAGTMDRVIVAKPSDILKRLCSAISALDGDGA